jgi:predicted RND superfamily exporter protein
MPYVVGKTVSVVDVLKEINQALHNGRADSYAIPGNRDLIAQEFLLFENSGSDDLEKVVDRQFSTARLSAKVPWSDFQTYQGFVQDLGDRARQILPGHAQVTTTGMLVLLTESVVALMNSMATSYAIAGVVITLLMILMLGNLKIGLVSMIPNLFPIVVTLGLMGWFDIPVDMFTLLIGSIAIGLAVDDTIHFMHNFKRYYGHSGNARWAVCESLRTTGRAMLFTTLVLVAGFWLFMFASLDNLFYFGLLTGMTILLALAADFVLAPALMVLFARTAKVV